MHKLRKDKTAVSEVIGALMLTLIVVIAASSFAVYVAEKQKVEQDNQELMDQKKQESLQILIIEPRKNSTGDAWSGFNFTVTSNHVGTSEIRKIVINDMIVRNLTLSRFNPNTGDETKLDVDYKETIELDPQESVILRFNFAGFFESPKNISTNLAITISLYTILNNVFQKSFQSPNSLITLSTQSWLNQTSGKYEQFVVLDGSNSQQVGGGFIVSWSWNVTNETTYFIDTTGQKVRWDPPYDGGVISDYTITLTVKNNYGMSGTSFVKYTY